MKTPREIILERHRSAESKLEKIRPEELAALARKSADTKSHAPSLLLVLDSAFAGFWQESLQPWRRAWAGLAAIWLGILALHLAANASSRPAVTETAATNNPQVLAELHEEKKLLAQLLELPALPAAAQPARASGPRSEQRQEFFIA